MTAVKLLETDTAGAIGIGPGAHTSVCVRANAKSLQDLWDQVPGSGGDADQEILANVRRHMRSGDLKAARSAFTESSCEDACILNLRGVVSEMEGRFSNATQDYKLALVRNPLCSAAKLNLQRYYELCTFGRSGIPFCL